MTLFLARSGSAPAAPHRNAPQPRGRPSPRTKPCSMTKLRS
jgi:hypothetical protein